MSTAESTILAGHIVLVLEGQTIVDISEPLAAAIGREREDLRGAPVADLPWVEQPPRRPKTPRSERVVRLRHGDRGALTLELRPAAVGNMGGSSEIWVGRPIEDQLPSRSEMQERLMLADRMTAVGTLAAGVAHEINNPLAMVLANLELLGDELARSKTAEGERARMRERIEAAMTATERVQRVVSDLRTFSRYDTGEVQPTDAAALLATTARLMEMELRTRARLEVELAQPPLIQANPAQLGQVFLNLLQNAALAIPEGRPESHLIRATCRKLAAHIEIVISDDGTGMDDEVRKRAFEPFFTTRAVGTGTGLGLSYCHNVVTSLGGQILLDSHPGRGTRASLLLPIPSLQVDVGDNATRVPAETSGAQLRILVVDDEPEIGELIGALLHEHHVESCNGGEQALEVLHAGWDIVLCDMMMPRVSGMQLFDVARRLHPDEAGGFIFLTGGATSAEVEEFLDRCGRPVLMKPFRTAQLRAAIDRAALERYS